MTEYCKRCGKELITRYVKPSHVMRDDMCGAADYNQTTGQPNPVWVKVFCPKANYFFGYEHTCYYVTQEEYYKRNASLAQLGP